MLTKKAHYLLNFASIFLPFLFSTFCSKKYEKRRFQQAFEVRSTTNNGQNIQHFYHNLWLAPFLIKSSLGRENSVEKDLGESRLCMLVIHCKKTTREENSHCFFDTWKRCNESVTVVSIGTNSTFKVKKVPMEYIPTMPKRLHFFCATFCLFNYTSSIF